MEIIEARLSLMLFLETRIASEQKLYDGFSISEVNGEIRRNPGIAAKEKDSLLEHLRQSNNRLDRIQKDRELLRLLENMS